MDRQLMLRDTMIKGKSETLLEKCSMNNAKWHYDQSEA